MGNNREPGKGSFQGKADRNVHLTPAGECVPVICTVATYRKALA